MSLIQRMNKTFAVVLGTKEHNGRVRGLGKGHNWSNTWNTPKDREWVHISQYEKEKA